ncbi:hypothetical protein GPECTOR_5g177 [Gonium pectorale]|uniref:Uncharacterized protein n=1 Tax=Gonium pectorale TaxID=33097 RepID=A0A150GXH4_GONPE|nr:hypothetical protein GPECTOR_5g177 [Gonium pectorale]|eukprot:KXZ54070.1 hypothetical protein GPECTOR_5g177 [Gonium pectorale]
MARWQAHHVNTTDLKQAYKALLEPLSPRAAEATHGLRPFYSGTVPAWELHGLADGEPYRLLLKTVLFMGELVFEGQYSAPYEFVQRLLSMAGGIIAER